MQVYAWTVLPFSLWDLVIEVFHSVPKRTDGPKRELRGNLSAVVKSNMHNTIPVKHTNVIPTNIDHIPSNTTNSGSSAMMYVFEDNEAVIKMIIKGRSPTMRHVSWTHRVALDWLFDRINLDFSRPATEIRKKECSTSSKSLARSECGARLAESGASRSVSTAAQQEQQIYSVEHRERSKYGDTACSLNPAPANTWNVILIFIRLQHRSCVLVG